VRPVEPQSWHHGLVARWWSLSRDSGSEVSRLTSNLYFCAEPVMMLERAGFSEVEVRGE